jgi:hypothetical protein
VDERGEARIGGPKQRERGTSAARPRRARVDARQRTYTTAKPGVSTSPLSLPQTAPLPVVAV